MLLTHKGRISSYPCVLKRCGVVEERLKRLAMEGVCTVIAPLRWTCGCVTPVLYRASASICLIHGVGARRKAGRSVPTGLPDLDMLHNIDRWRGSCLHLSSRHWLGMNNSSSSFLDRMSSWSRRANSTAAERVPRMSARPEAQGYFCGSASVVIGTSSSGNMGSRGPQWSCAGTVHLYTRQVLSGVKRWKTSGTRAKGALLRRDGITKELMWAAPSSCIPMTFL